jgi:CBS domain-containing protein
MAIQPMLVQDFMSVAPVTVKPLDTVETVLKLLEEKHISGLPVVDEDGKVAGVISEADLLFKERPIRMPLYLIFLDGVIYLEPLDKFKQQLKKTLGILVQDVMTPNPITITPVTLVSQAADLMLEKRINRLPVVDEEGKLIGIITRNDLLRALELEPNFSA